MICFLQVISNIRLTLLTLRLTASSMLGSSKWLDTKKSPSNKTKKMGIAHKKNLHHFLSSRDTKQSPVGDGNGTGFVCHTESATTVTASRPGWRPVRHMAEPARTASPSCNPEYLPEKPAHRLQPLPRVVSSAAFLMVAFRRRSYFKCVRKPAACATISRSGKMTVRFHTLRACSRCGSHPGRGTI